MKRRTLYNGLALFVGVLAVAFLSANECSPAGPSNGGGQPSNGLEATGGVTGTLSGASGDCGSFMGKFGSEDVTIFLTTDGSVVIQVITSTGQDSYQGTKVVTFSGTGKDEVATFNGTAVDKTTGKAITLIGTLKCGALK